MTNQFIHLQSECMRILQVERIEEFVHSANENYMQTRLWINANNHTFIDFELYSILDFIQLNEKIIIEHILYTVIEIIQRPEHSSIILS